ncbi:MAG: hypothetical protein A2Y24_00955 [Clostridiales bacterium GWE2_32_10]|nr:MAG: hypothetical protein A2Y24_00955 [Clostridiales bacterium GWE2_32_10]HBY19457.1 AAA family ATPase [Clostridiales bacterium]
MEDMVKVYINEEEQRYYEKGVTLLEISKDFKEKYRTPIVLARINNELYELHNSIDEDCNIIFYDLTNSDGIRMYIRSLTFVLNMAMLELYKDYRLMVYHSIDNGLYCEMKNGEGAFVAEDELYKIEEKMREIVDRDLAFEKVALNKKEAIAKFTGNKASKKVQLFKYRNSTQVNMYKLDWFYDYYYGYMVPNTGYLQKFKLTHKYPGFILNYPLNISADEGVKNSNSYKLFNVFMESAKWAEILDVNTVVDLNDTIARGDVGDLILISEALQEKKIGLIADMIQKRESNVGVILIAGPSSSGKTTFSKRLSIQLKADGYNPHAISLDDYFVDREHTPINEDGKPDYEALLALDINLFNQNMNDLLAGKEVDLPVFNFKKGQREYIGNIMKLKENDILIIEGIHGLNPELTKNIPDDKKFKIYVSALTQINLDEHNRIPTTDNRLLRRIVRDNNFRGYGAEKTIDMWSQVRKGEEKNIFPYQEQADVMFNSAMVYEIAVLKQYAAPLLYNIDSSMPEYVEAKRLLKFLDYVLGISSDKVPANSLVREFIGGSCFY